MTVAIEVTRVACNTATGTQDITISGFGTAKAALFICSVATTDGTAADDFNLSIGAATGTANEWCLTMSNEHSQVTTDIQSVPVSDRCVQINDAGTSVVDGDAEFTAFITDGVRINWLTAPSAAWLLTVVLLGGSNLSAHANNASLTTVNVAVDITAPGFEPEAIIAVCQGSGAMDVPKTQLIPSFGVVHNDGAGGITQHSAAYRYPGAAGTAHGNSRVTETYGIMEIDTAATVNWGGEFDDFDSSGFSVTPRVGGGGGTGLMYLALSFGGAFDSWVGTVDTPTSTGNDSETGPGFEPKFVYEIGTQMLAIDTAYSDSEWAGTIGLGTFTGDDEFMTSGQAEEGVGTTDTQSMSDNQAVRLPDDDGSTGIQAAFVSMDVTGYTLNYSQVKGSARKFLTLAIAANPAGALTLRRRSVCGPY